MKKYLVTFALITFIAACGGNAGNEKKGENTSASTGDITENPDYKAGLDLISKSDCLTCHKISEKLVGPPYQDVANKYAGSDTAVAHLAKKIIEGGQGVWGQTPMVGHPALSQADAEQMVKYILLLKTQ